MNDMWYIEVANAPKLNSTAGEIPTTAAPSDVGASASAIALGNGLIGRKSAKAILGTARRSGARRL